MSKTVISQLPFIKLAAQEKNINKRKRLIKTCCDDNFTKAISECCWNLVNGRVPLSYQKKNRLCKHKRILRELSNKSKNLKLKKKIIQGGGFATALPLLIGPVLAGLKVLFKK